MYCDYTADQGLCDCNGHLDVEHLSNGAEENGNTSFLCILIFFRMVICVYFKCDVIQFPCG